MNMTRRTFTKSVLAGVGATMLGHRVEAASKYPEGTYVDIHTHLGQEWGNRPELTAKGLLDWMDTKHSYLRSAIIFIFLPSYPPPSLMDRPAQAAKSAVDLT